MNTLVDACRESSAKACKAAHIGGCIAAIVVMAVIVPTKLGGYVPTSMTSLRLMLLPVLAYGLIYCAMLWKLGRTIKRLKAVDDELPTAMKIPRQAG